MVRKNINRKMRETEKDFSQTPTEGAIRELLVAIKLMEQGYVVSTPIVQNRYDLIAEKYPNFFRIQVKNLKLDYEKDENHPLSLDQWVIRAFSSPRKQKEIYGKEDIDVVFAINLDSHDYAIIPIEKIPLSGIVKISVKSDRKNYLNSFIALEEQIELKSGIIRRL